MARCPWSFVTRFGPAHGPQTQAWECGFCGWIVAGADFEHGEPAPCAERLAPTPGGE